MAEVAVVPPGECIKPLFEGADQSQRAWVFQEYVRVTADPAFDDITVRTLEKIAVWIKTGVVPVERTATPRHLKAVDPSKA